MATAMMVSTAKAEEIQIYERRRAISKEMGDPDRVTHRVECEDVVRINSHVRRDVQILAMFDVCFLSGT